MAYDDFCNEMMNLGGYEIALNQTVPTVTVADEKLAAKEAKEQERAAAKAAKAAQAELDKAAKAEARAAAKAIKAAEKAAELAAAEAKAKQIEQAVQGVLAKGNELAEKYAAAEEDKIEFKNKSHQVTYDLLVEVLAYVEELDKRTDINDVLAAMKTQLKREWKIKTQENSSDMTVIVKYITRTKRKNAHMYARVLEEARRHKATSATLLKYIETRGGINKIVAGSKAKNISNKERLHNAYSRYAQAKLCHQQHAGGMGKIKLTDKQKNYHYDSRDNAHFVYAFCKIEGDELVVVDFVPFVNKEDEKKYLTYNTLAERKLLTDYYGPEKASKMIEERMAEMFEKFNAGRIKNNLPSINGLGEVESGHQPENFSVFNWKQFEHDYAEYLAAKSLQSA